MRKKPIDKKLIQEISDMKRMMGKLETKSYEEYPYLINEEQILNEQPGGGCDPPCTGIEHCCPVNTGGFNQGSTVNWSYSCCNGICNTMTGCHPYPPGWGTTPSPGSGVSCTEANTGCRQPGFLNFSSDHECDCDGNYWGQINAGAGDTSCCSNQTNAPAPTGTGSNSPSGSSGSSGSSQGSGNCFIKDSKVLMANGESKNIQDIEIGDIVKSEIGESKVVGIDIHKGEFEIYSFNDDKPLTTTDHPFKTLEGWKALNPIKATKTHRIQSDILKEGDTLVKLNGEVEIKKIVKDENIHDVVYNLILDNEHVYYVNEYLVHNKQVLDNPFGMPLEDPTDNPERVTPGTSGEEEEDIAMKQRRTRLRNPKNFKSPTRRR
tara:strand:- start:84 stop:1214 length:1131 start_codon:yes stop_codon:yes gene_type:complete